MTSSTSNWRDWALRALLPGVVTCALVLGATGYVQSRTNEQRITDSANKNVEAAGELRALRGAVESMRTEVLQRLTRVETKLETR